jgi:hypothetical protein
VFPRSRFLRNSEELADTDLLFPSFREITNIIREAEEEAITFASLLGMFKEDICYTTVCNAEQSEVQTICGRFRIVKRGNH